MNTNWLVGFLAAVIVILGAGEYVLVNKSAPAQIAGAVPSLQSPLCINGVCEYYISQPIRTASSTACDIQTPNATTSVAQISAYFATSPTYAQTFVLAYSATQDASTSVVASLTGSGIAGDTLNATTTATAPVDKLLPPKDYIVLNLSTSTATGLNQSTGICEVRLTAVNGNGTSFSN